MRARNLAVFGYTSAIIAVAACSSPASSGDGNDEAAARSVGAPDASTPVESSASDAAASKNNALPPTQVFVGSHDSPLDAGLADASPADAASDAGGCGAGAGALDQDQLASDGNIVISNSQSPAQTFQVGSSGILTGIEFGLASCNGVDPNASIVLTLTRGSSTIATASVMASAVSTTSCGGISLSSSEISAGFFDLSDQCVAVTAGDALTATLTIAGSTGTCSSTNHQCTGGSGSNFCMDDSDCQYAGRLGMTGDVYANGGMLVNGNTDSQWDASFKTFVR
jgi:hypothetical protein